MLAHCKGMDKDCQALPGICAMLTTKRSHLL